MVCVILNAFEYCLPTTFGQYIPHLTPAPVRIPTWPGWKKAFPLRSLPLPDTPSTKLVNITITRTFCCQIICQKSGAVSSPGPGNQIDIFIGHPKSTKGQGNVLRKTPVITRATKRISSHEQLCQKMLNFLIRGRLAVWKDMDRPKLLSFF